MAEKVTQELERIYTIPLRTVQTSPRNHRADRAIRFVKRYLERHMKSQEIWIDASVNELLWARGMYTIPSRIRVRARRFDDGVVEVSLPEAEVKESIRTQIKERQEKAQEKKEEKKEEETKPSKEEAASEEKPKEAPAPSEAPAAPAEKKESAAPSKPASPPSASEKPKGNAKPAAAGAAKPKSEGAAPGGKSKPASDQK